MREIGKTQQGVGHVIRRTLRGQHDSSIQIGAPLRQTPAERQQRRRAHRASMVAWAGFACAASVAHSQVITCYPGGGPCYGGPFFDPNGGFYSSVELWPTDHGLSWFGQIWSDPAPRVTPPSPPAHHFGGLLAADPISGSDVPSQSLMYWQQYEQSASNDANPDAGRIRRCPRLEPAWGERELRRRLLLGRASDLAV